MLINIIAAIGKNRELGKDNKLLWYIPNDFKRFKDLTSGHIVIMGRKTFESIGKPLSNRINIIVTRNQQSDGNDMLARKVKVHVCNTLEEAINLAKQYDQKEIFIIGGGQIYAQAIDLADKLYLTIVKGKYDADTFFPDYSQFNKVIFKQEKSDKNYQYTFLGLVRLDRQIKPML